MSITLQEIYEAYRKFKSFVYYDGQSLSLRSQLAAFEVGMLEGDLKPGESARRSFKRKFKHKMQPLLELFSEKPATKRKAETIFNEWVEQITYSIVPKKWKTPNSENRRLISNVNSCEDVTLESCNFIIDAPIELYLLSTLWTIIIGRQLSQYISEDNYAYRLSFCKHEEFSTGEDVEVSSGLSLYEPYYKGYQQWRDRGLDLVSRALEEKNNAVVLTLDIHRFFYNVKLNVTEVTTYYLKAKTGGELQGDEETLCYLLQKIHEKYASLFSEIIPHDDGTNKFVMLPIGLPSSGLLGNLALVPFDDYIRTQVSPAYFGRYVDDIFLVFSGNNLKLNQDTKDDNVINEFINIHLVKNEKIVGSYSKHVDPNLKVSFSNEIDNEKGKYIITVGESVFSLQREKILMQYFDWQGSKAGINILKKELEKNRSEFRYLPWEYAIDIEFDDEAFKLKYSDSLAKLRDVKGISENKYGASKFLAKKIFLSILPFESESEESRKTSARQILTFFQGRTAILMESLWEKVITYFVVTNQPKYIKQFWLQVKEAIEDIRSHTEDGDMPQVCTEKAKTALEKNLELSMAMGLSLVPELISALKLSKDQKDSIYKISNYFRSTYLFRHQYQYLKGYCFTLDMQEEKTVIGNNLISERVDWFSDSSVASYVSPVFVKPHDIVLIYVFYSLSHHKVPVFTKKDFNDKIEDVFTKFNYEWRRLFKRPKSELNENSSNFSKCIEIGDIDCHFTGVHLFDFKDEIGADEIEVDKKIGVVNWKINKEDLERCLKGCPNNSSERKKNLIEVLNYANKNKVEILVFPETSIPVDWLPLLVEQSVKLNCSIIGGLEYYVTPGTGYIKEDNYFVGQEVFNLIFNIMPIKMRYYNTAICLLRNKNYYAPEEQTYITAYHKEEPKLFSSYQFIHWRKIYFATYNCFELTNIMDRAIFKSKVDFIVAIEYNKDVNYFMNITEAWIRDLHSYIIQSNTSDFGDSKIVQPSKTECKDIMKIKGGDRPLVMITTLKINDLRQFQRLDARGQAKSKSVTSFKPTPANFEWQWVERRIQDLPLGEYWFKSSNDED